MSKFCTWMFLLLIVSSLCGCTALGPKKIGSDRNTYNDIIQSTTNQQVLENIVKLRYNEEPSFLKVMNITATYQRSYEHNITSSLSKTVLSATNPITPSGTELTIARAYNPIYTYADVPSIVYAPIDNQTFTTAILTPLSLRQMFSLAFGSTFAMNRVARMTVQTANNID